MKVVLNDRTLRVIRRSFKRLNERERSGSEEMAWLVSPAFAICPYTSYRSADYTESITEKEWACLQGTLRSIVSIAVVAHTPGGQGTGGVAGLTNYFYHFDNNTVIVVLYWFSETTKIGAPIYAAAH